MLHAKSGNKEVKMQHEETVKILILKSGKFERLEQAKIMRNK